MPTAEGYHEWYETWVCEHPDCDAVLCNDPACGCAEEHSHAE